jgi:hypothetical protein
MFFNTNVRLAHHLGGQPLGARRVRADISNNPEARAPAAARKRQRVMAKKNRVSAATSALVLAVSVAGVCLGLEGCTAAAANPKDRGQAAQSVDEARVTGYASSNGLTGVLSGPVSIALHGASAAGIDQLITGLQGNTRPGCMENTQLYQITFTAVAGSKRGFDVVGYQCGGLVDLTSDGTTVTRIDRNCTLLSAVRRLLPATATATQRLTAPCAS